MGRARAIRVFAVIAILGFALQQGLGIVSQPLEAGTRLRISVVGLALSPQQVAGGGPTSATVTISGAAPRGGVAVSLSSSNTAAAYLPSASVTIPSGQTSAKFTVDTKPVNSSVQVALSATLHQTVSATLAVEPPQVSSVTFAPAVVTGSQSSSATVVLTSAAAAPGATVALASNNADISVPATVTVPAGATSVSFVVHTVAVASSASATTTASFSGSSKSAILTINPPAVAAVAFNPASVSAGQMSTCTVTLNAIAPSGGFPVALTSNSTAVPVPASVIVPTGSTVQSFSVATGSVSSSQMAMVVATTGTTTAIGTLTVTPLAAPSLSSVSFSPTSVTGGAGSTGSVALNAAASSGGVTVALTSSDPSVTLPASIVVAAGSASQSFAAATTSVSTSKNVVVTATLGTSSANAVLTVNAAVVSGLSFSPATVGFDQVTTGTVSLTGAAPSGSLAVSLASNDPGAIPVPVSVQVPAGASSQSFTVTAGAVTSVSTVAITASTGSTAVMASLTVNPALTATPPNVVFASGTLVGVPSTQTVKLSNTAPVSVTLTSIATSAEFTQTNTCPAALSSGASCVITFTPNQGGSLTSNVTILSSAGNSALTVNLSGAASHWVALGWTASSTPGVSYNVYRQLQSGGACGAPSSTTYTRLNTSPVGSTAYNDTDASLVAGDTYCYSATAVDAAGESAFAAPPAAATLPSP